MKARIVILACLLSLYWAATPGQGDSFGSRPLAFEANRGQTDERVKFLARGPGYTVFLTGSEAILVSSARQQERAVVTMTLAGADPAPHIVAGMELPGRVNYFRGGVPTGQVADVPTYASVKYVDVYPGVDLVYYGRERQLEYDFIVAPAASPEVIALAFDGASRVDVEEHF